MAVGAVLAKAGSRPIPSAPAVGSYSTPRSPREPTPEEAIPAPRPRPKCPRSHSSLHKTPRPLTDVRPSRWWCTRVACQHGAHSSNTALSRAQRRVSGVFLARYSALYPLPGRGAAPRALAANRGARRPCAGARIPCSPPIPTRSRARRLAVGELEPPFCAQAGRRVCGQCGKTAQTAGRACRPVSGHATRASQHAGSCRQMQRAEGGVGAGGQSPPLHTNNSRPLKLE